MRPTIGALAVVSFTLSTTANAAGWLCITEHATGFSYNTSSKAWKETSFRVDKRYLVRANKKDGLTWEVVEFGEKNDVPSSECGTAPNEAGILVCKGMGNEFRINVKNNRFIYVYLLGYWTYDPNSWLFASEGGDTPLMAIGKCSSL